MTALTSTSQHLKRIVDIGSRSFTKLDIAYNSHQYHPFFLERFANARFGSKYCIGYETISFIQLLACSRTNWTWIALFGHNLNVPHSKLLVRAWLNATAHTNRALVLIDNVDDLCEDDLHTYMIHVNNKSWRPHDWSEIEGAKTLHQSVCEQSWLTRWLYSIVYTW